MSVNVSIIFEHVFDVQHVDDEVGTVQYTVQ